MAVQSVLARYEALLESAKSILASRDEANKIRIQVGSATCENAAGAREVFDEFRKHLEASGRHDIVLRQTGCTGRCSREPIVSVSIPGEVPIKYERVDRDLVHRIFTQHVQGGQPVAGNILDLHGPVKHVFYFCSGARCGRQIMEGFQSTLDAKLKAAGLDPSQYSIVEANCFGLCLADHAGESVQLLISPSKVMYQLRTDADLDRVIQEDILGGQIVADLQVKDRPFTQHFFELYGDVAFFNNQTRLALRNSGLIDPEDLSEYLACDGFRALAMVLDKGDPSWTIEQVKQSKLRGRGGAGFPTGIKWELTARSPGDEKYVICNADEGDPGAFMDRSTLEGDPFSVLEGMMIAGYAIGAQHGFFYIRAEYPLALARVENAIRVCRERGILGPRVLGSDFDFDVEVRLGAGAFVCGEETALIHSIEGKRGQPRVRPPYPAESGLWGKPTVINNVETLSNVPVVFLYGPQWFASVGTAKSGGTKVFALAGKVRHTGLVEVPMGTTLRHVVYEIGGGVRGGKKLKAIQTGGPAGGCIPAQHLDTPVDYDTLMSLGSIMGSGGMIVMDEDDCMVDIAKYFLTFSQDESCGKCTPCREGTMRMLEIVERITEGKGEPADLDRLERLANLVRKASLCGLGRAAPNPVLSTLRFFRHEYEAHVFDKRCPAKKCVALIHYEIDPAKCVGCTACARNCPVPCIAGSPRKTHVIDQARCIRCGRCFQVCRFGAVARA